MRLEKLSVAFGEKEVFRELSADIPGGIVCLMGPSGRGKTTLLRCIAGLVIPQSGRMEGLPLRPAMMFQEDRLFPWFTVKQNLLLVCPDAEAVGRMLREVELADEADALPSSLSGGMQRRVALARALLFDGDYLLLDEPFKGMDPALTERMAQLILRRGLPAIVTTHSPAEAALLGGQIVQI